MAKPEPSDWGKLNGGQVYQVLALDVLRALRAASLNTYEWMLFGEIMEQSWYTSARRKRHEEDWPDPLPCKLNMTEFARDNLTDAEKADPKAVKALRTRLYEAKATLAGDNMIREDEDGLWPVKEADLWGHKDSKTGAWVPRIHPGRLAYAIAARTRKALAKAGAPCTENRIPDNGAVSGNPDTDNRQISGNPDMRIRKSGYDHIEGTRGIKIPEEKQEERAPAAELEPFENVSAADSITGPGKDHPDAQALAKWATQLGGDYSFWAAESCAVAPVEWVRLVLQRKVVGRPKRPSVFVLAKILSDWIAAGKPEEQSNGRSGAPPEPPAPELKFHTARRGRS